jgi:hypothetical protein
MVGKGYRLSAHTLPKAYKERHPLPFFVFPGHSDILLSRASCIAGTGASRISMLKILQQNLNAKTLTVQVSPCPIPHLLYHASSPSSTTTELPGPLDDMHYIIIL